MADLKRAFFGYSSASVRSVLLDNEGMLARAAGEARAAEEKAERLSSDLWETQSRLGELQNELDSAQRLAETLTVDLERSVAQRERMEAEAVALRQELQDAHAELGTVRQTILEIETQLRAANERTAVVEADLATRSGERDELAQQAADARAECTRLEESLRQSTKSTMEAREEASKGQHWLRRALEESAEYKTSLSAQQQRIDELEELLATYRAELEERGRAVISVTDPSEAPGGGPSTARELAAVLQDAEQAVVRIMESTRARADEELRTVDADRERIKRDVETMTAWRDRAAPMIGSLKAAMDEMQGHVAEIGLRVTDVLRPVTGAVTRLSTLLASLDSLSRATPDVGERPSGSSEDARVIELREEHITGRDASRDQ